MSAEQALTVAEFEARVWKTEKDEHLEKIAEEETARKAADDEEALRDAKKELQKLVEKDRATVREVAEERAAQEAEQQIARPTKITLEEDMINRRTLAKLAAAKARAEREDLLRNEKNRKSTQLRRISFTAEQEDYEKLALDGIRLWKVVGGRYSEGITVRIGESLTSSALDLRLKTGTLVEELDLVGNRLRFRRWNGFGPDCGWVSIEFQGQKVMKLLNGDS